MVRNVREHRTAIHVFTAKGFREINAVDHVVPGLLDVQHAQNRWIQIRRLNANVATRPGIGNARPDDHCGNANTAIVDASLAAAQRVVARNGRDVVLA